MSNPCIDFLYLSEPDVLRAGGADMARCVEVMCEAFGLLGCGDYVMGGPNANSHGISLRFPEHPAFPGMPADGADRRFMAMIAYLGGRFRVAGEKWYGSNRANLSKSLPRSILMICLNDPDTGAPLAFMSGNVISAMRTGAIPGLGARYLARPDSSLAGLVGAGVVSRTCFQSIAIACPGLERVKIYDLRAEAAEALAADIRRDHPGIEPEVVPGLREAVEGADVVNVATSGAVYPYFEDAWIKPGAYLSLPASAEFPKGFTLKTKKVVDNWKMYQLWKQELAGLPGGYPANFGSLSAYFMEYIDSGELDESEIVSLGDIVTGRVPGRESDEETILFVQGGLPIEDVAWAHEVYRNAQRLGIGTTLPLWNQPALF